MAGIPVWLTGWLLCLPLMLQISAAPLEGTSSTSLATPTAPTTSSNTSQQDKNTSQGVSNSSNASSTLHASTEVSTSVPEIVALITAIPIPVENNSSEAAITTEDPFGSDESIRHLPGYWIKRPMATLHHHDRETTGEDEEVMVHEDVEEDEEDFVGEAQESQHYIDYRTERYRITDLFPAPVISVSDDGEHTGHLQVSSAQEDSSE